MIATKKRLIDADAYIEEYQVAAKNARKIGGTSMCLLADFYYEVIEDIKKRPTVDAVEVVYGHNLRDHDSAFECSVCGWENWDTITADTSQYNYCPNCGAKMDGK